MKTLPSIYLVLMLPVAAAAGAAPDWRPLLDAKLSQFDVYLSYPGTVIRDVIAKQAPADRASAALGAAIEQVLDGLETQPDGSVLSWMLPQ